MRGEIVRMVQDRGFGFIRVDGQQTDAFFHRKDLNGLVMDDALLHRRVSFDLETTIKGFSARNVRGE